MATEIFISRSLDGSLRPVDPEGHAAILEMPLGQTLKAVVTLPRNYKRLKWWWKLCSIVAENSQHYESREAVSDMLKLKCGHFRTVIVPGKRPGEWVQQYTPKSIAFSKLDEPTFKELCNKAVSICAALVLECREADLHDAVDAFFAGRRAA
ncbi:MAG: hypothetical protein AAGJ50_10640 [Pseudomonadota bacterium]